MAMNMSRLVLLVSVLSLSVSIRASLPTQRRPGISLGWDDLRKFRANSWVVSKGAVYGAGAGVFALLGHSFATEGPIITLSQDKAALAAMGGALLGTGVAISLLPKYNAQRNRLAQLEQNAVELEQLRARNLSLQGLETEVAQLNTQAVRLNAQMQELAMVAQTSQAAAQEANARLKSIEEAGALVLRNQCGALMVSRAHFQVSLDAQELTMTDLQSRNVPIPLGIANRFEEHKKLLEAFNKLGFVGGLPLDLTPLQAVLPAHHSTLRA